MTYSRPPFPRALYRKFCDVASSLGYGKRGDKWKLLDVILEYTREHAAIFRKR